MKISLQFDGYDEFTKYMGRFAEITHLLKGETGKATIQVQMPAEVSTTTNSYTSTASSYTSTASCCSDTTRGSICTSTASYSVSYTCSN